TGATGGLLDVRWDICSEMEGDDDDEHDREILGTIIWGESLVIPDHPMFTASSRGLEPRGPRHNGDFFAESVWELPHDCVEPDMLVMGLQTFFLDPDDDVQNVEVEILGKSYDGSTFTWELGGGMSAAGPVLAEPVVATLFRKSRFQRGELVAQDL